LVNKISVVILTKNSQKYIYECLKSLVKFDEVVILDNGSTDNTLEIANEFSNVKIHLHEFIGFGPLKNLAISYTKYDWILSIDSDEIFSESLVDEILSKPLIPTCVYAIQRDNYYKNKLIKCCGWQNDYVYRLFNKNITSFNNKPVHESVILENMKTEKLKNRFKHYSFGNPSELLQKMDKYSSLYAQEYSLVKKSSPLKAFIRAFVAFLKNYFFQRGFLCGYEGLLISISNANGVFYKYIKLYEENKK